MKRVLLTIVISIIHQATCLAQGPIWTNVMQSKFNATATSIEQDPFGNYWVAGFFMDTLVLDTGNATYGQLNTSATLLDEDIFLAKYNSSGNLIWSGSMGNVNRDWTEDMIVDDSGNVYLLGEFSYNVDFDFSTDTFYANSLRPLDIFLAKYDNNASLKWVISFGNWREETVSDLHMDSNCDLLVIGDMADTVDFDPGPGTTYLYGNGYFDMFLAKYTNHGQFIWARNMGSDDFDYGKAVTTDQNNDIYITGEFSDTIYMDSNYTASHITSNPLGTDIVMAKYSSNGIYQWSHRLGNTNYEYAEKIVTDANNNLYLGGSFNGTMDFDPSSATHNMTATYQNMYIAKYTKDGDFTWSRSFSGDYNWANTLDLDPLGNLLISGFHTDLLDVDPSSTILYDTALWADPIAISISQNGDYLSHIGIHNYGNEGSNDVLMNNSGDLVFCGAFDSLFVLSTSDTVENLKIPFWDFYDGFIGAAPITCFSNHDSISHVICNGDSILIDGVYRKSAGFYSDTIATIGNCFYVTTNEVVIDSGYNTSTQTAICTGDSIYLAGAWRKTTGIYSQLYSSVYGCDSLVDVNLTVHTINNGVNVSSNVLSSQESGATYQWYDCNLGTIIQGETGMSFTALTNGSFAVIITKNNCTDTSMCENITGIGIDSRETSENIFLSPNPNTGSFLVVLPELTKEVQVRILDIRGKEFFRNYYTNIKSIDVTFNGDAGLYFVEISDSNGHVVSLKMLVD